MVIGILIALQINNWNEAQKGLATEKQRYQNLIIDLKNDLVHIDQMITDLKTKQDVHYEFYEISQNGKIRDSSIILSGINRALALHLVTGKNQLTELEYIKNLQMRKKINHYIILENAAQDDSYRLENLIKTSVRKYFHELNVVMIKSVFVPSRYENTTIRPSFDHEILSAHFDDADFKGMIINLRMLTVNALNTLKTLKEENEALQSILNNKL